MTGSDWFKLIVGAIAALAGYQSIVQYFVKRRDARAEKQEKAEATGSELDEVRAARLDARQLGEIERLDLSNTALKERIEDLENDFRAFRRDAEKENHEVRDKLYRVQRIVREWWNRVLRWQENPVGPMPMPSDAEMHEMELEPIAPIRLDKEETPTGAESYE